jgi:hypothetical protein
LLLTFVRGISESRHQQIWNQHKILRFLDTHIDIFQEKFFLGHNSTFYNIKMHMQKKLYIFKHFAKSKKLLFCQYLSFSVWFQLKFQKSIKLKPPNVPFPLPYYGLLMQSLFYIAPNHKNMPPQINKKGRCVKQIWIEQTSWHTKVE